MASSARNGGFLFPERRLFIFVIGGFFHPDYAKKTSVVGLQRTILKQLVS